MLFLSYIHMNRILYYNNIPNTSFNKLNDEQKNIIITELSKEFDPELVRHYFNDQKIDNVMSVYSSLLNFVYPPNMD